MGQAVQSNAAPIMARAGTAKPAQAQTGDRARPQDLEEFSLGKIHGVQSRAGKAGRGPKESPGRGPGRDPGGAYLLTGEAGSSSSASDSALSSGKRP